jgi:hypothetical protein
LRTLAIDTPKPVRGSIAPTVSASSPQTVAGSDFSIFVVIQNPFEVPITLYQVQTHIPVELMDVNRQRLESTRQAADHGATAENWLNRLTRPWVHRRRLRETQTAIATAVGTDIDPGEAVELIAGKVEVGGRYTALRRVSR